MTVSTTLYSSPLATLPPWVFRNGIIGRTRTA